MSVFDGSLESVCTAWRKAVRRIWRIPWRTHNNMLPIIAGVMSPDLMFAKRSINFINYSMFSNNIVIKTITRMGMASCHSRIGANTRHLHACFGMNASNVDSYWKRYVDSNSIEVYRGKADSTKIPYYRPNMYTFRVVISQLHTSFPVF